MTVNEQTGEVVVRPEFMPLDIQNMLDKINYIEQFRMMAFRDEEVIVSGILEHVERRNTEYHQVTLSYPPGWEANVLKTIDAVEF